MRTSTRILAIALLPFAAACGAAPSPATAPATTSATAPATTASHDATSAPAPDVDGPAAHELVAGGAALVDVRTPQEFSEKHIDGAVNVPVDDVASHDFGPKDRAIVVYCRSGRRSARAAETLRGRGYTNVRSLGGMSRWDDK